MYRIYPLASRAMFGAQTIAVLSFCSLVLPLCSTTMNREVSDQPFSRPIFSWLFIPDLWNFNPILCTKPPISKSTSLCLWRCDPIYRRVVIFPPLVIHNVIFKVSGTGLGVKIVNYWMRLSRMWRIMQIRILRKPNSMSFSIIHPKYFSFLTSYLIVDFLQKFGLFLGKHSGYK